MRTAKRGLLFRHQTLGPRNAPPVPAHDKGLCAQTNKLRYETEQDALAVRDHWARHPDQPSRARRGMPLPCRAYQCEHCGDHHLTSHAAT